ncbi:MAG: hypothetical protein KJS68_05005, partial [Alphaproteobacteria bacterium]|nr:hypothetical protein [Alphaproteobacteria bacterium]
IEGFSHFVTSMTAPIASGWSEVAGRASHPLESAALSRRTPTPVIRSASYWETPIVTYWRSCWKLNAPDRWMLNGGRNARNHSGNCFGDGELGIRRCAGSYR